MLLWRCAVHITCGPQHKFVYFVSPSLRCNTGSLPATVNQTQTPTSTLADLFSSFLIIKNLWIFDYKNGWLNVISVGLKSFDAFHLPLRLDGSNAVFNFVIFHISLQRQVHSISVCGGVSWGWWWSCEGGSAWSYLHGRHGLWHGQLLSAGTEQTDRDVTWTILTATLQCQWVIYKCTSASILWCLCRWHSKLVALMRQDTFMTS